MAEPDCAAPVAIDAPIGVLKPRERVTDYRNRLAVCHSDAGAQRLAIRAMRVEGEALLLTVDPQSLETRLERQACWTCEETATPPASRYLDAIASSSARRGKTLPPGATWLDNAGLVRGRGPGSFVTGDLCPSRKPLDRDFLQSLGDATPIALSITGVWIRQHPDDFAWLRQRQKDGKLKITFVNHSFHHPYLPGLSDGRNFLLTPDMESRKLEEIHDVERLLIANGETPSVFFRFPGLISDPAWMKTLAGAHLIPLGADAWLAQGVGKPAPGAIVLIHLNGNEPLGLSAFNRLNARDALRPFRPLNEAP